ncbi:MAG: GNAT family N-acetyltransferase [Candidatus Bathyarchaeia archaeon]
MSNRTGIENLHDQNIDDLINVCSSGKFSDPVHQQGVKLKKLWLKEMLDNYGSCAKIAYYNGKPAAQILFYPENADKAKMFKREGVIVINCIYNPTLEAQKLGFGRRLLQSVIQDAKEKKSCLGCKPCKFILANAFNTGEFLPMPDFYKKNGFIPADGEGMYLPIEGGYEPVPEAHYEPLEEDKGKAIIFYGSKCQFSYPFAKRIEAMVRDTAPSLQIEVTNEWEKPEESIKRRNWWLVVNAKPIHTFFMDAENFKKEIMQAIDQTR